MYNSPKRSRLRKMFHGLLTLSVIGVSLAPAVTTANWDPTLLVNTESFVEIDDGDGSTDIELRFGGTTNRLYFDATTNAFTFTKGIIANGTITGSTLAATGLTNCSNVTTNSDGTLICGGTAALEAGFDQRYINSAGDTMTGALVLSGANLTVNNGGNVNVTGGDITTDQAITGATLGATGTIFAGDDVNVTNDANVGGDVNATGNVNTDGGVTLNADGTADTATLTFGGSASETIQFSSGQFNFSDDVAVTGNVTATGDITAAGNLSGNSLTVSSGTVGINGVDYVFDDTQGAANTVLQNDGNGNLTWQTISIGDGSGSFISLSPQYTNATYAPDGSNNVGRMKLDVTGGENYYEWTTTRPTTQDYDINVRFRVPDNFAGWAPNGVQMQYLNGSGSTAAISVLDTTGAADTSGTGPANASGTVNLSPSGTYTAGGYMTAVIKMAATNAGSAKVGFLNINWLTTTP